MKTLTEIYNSNQNVRESDIPKDWLPSFNKFIFGSACTIDYNKDGTLKEFVFYIHDFRSWYNRHRKEIERDECIKKILE